MFNKRGIVWNETIWWILGLAVLAIVIALIVLLNTAGSTLGEKILNIFKFGRG